MFNFYHLSFTPSSFFLSFTIQIVFSIQNEHEVFAIKAVICPKAAAIMVYTQGRRNVLVIPLCVLCHRILSEYSNLTMPLLLTSTSYTNMRYCLFWTEGDFFEGSFENEGSICGSDSTFYRQTEGMLLKPLLIKTQALHFGLLDN